MLCAFHPIAEFAIAVRIRLFAPDSGTLYREKWGYFSRGYHNPCGRRDGSQKANMGQIFAGYDGGCSRMAGERQELARKAEELRRKGRRMQYGGADLNAPIASAIKLLY